MKYIFLSSLLYCLKPKWNLLTKSVYTESNCLLIPGELYSNDIEWTRNEVKIIFWNAKNKKELRCEQKKTLKIYMNFMCY